MFRFVVARATNADTDSNAGTSWRSRSRRRTRQQHGTENHFCDTFHDELLYLSLSSIEVIETRPPLETDLVLAD